MSQIDQNDPRLTAYALDEMSAAERATFEPLLRDDTAAAAFVDELRRTAALLGDALAGEPLPARCVVLPPRRRSWLRTLLVESWTIWVPLGAAAAFGLYFWQIYLPRHDRELRTAQLAAARAPEGPSGIPFHQVSIEPFQGTPTGAASTTPRPAEAPPAAPTPGFNDANEHTVKTAHFLATKQYPSSAFGIGIGNAAFADIRRCLEAGLRPPSGLVRIEELVNHFAYRYPQPGGGESVAVATEMHLAPWDAEHLLVRIGVQGREPTAPPANPPQVAREALAAVAAEGIRELAARDVKVQVEFNPKKVLAYRLLGYEGRLLRADDADLGGSDLAAGRSVTALYELIPSAAPKPAAPATTVARGAAPPTPDPSDTAAWLTVKLRYTEADAPRGRTLIVPLHAPAENADTPVVASNDFQFAAAVAGFGLLLQDNPNTGSASWDMIESLARAGSAKNGNPERDDFMTMIRKAREVAPEAGQQPAAP